MLIESMACIFIVLIIISISLNIGIRLINSTNDRVKMVKMGEDMYAVCNELKYNISIDSIKQELITGTKSFDYNNDLIKKLEVSNIFLLNNKENEEEVLNIELLEINSAYLKIKVIIKSNGELLEEEIIKAEWMDEI